jgi:cytochrome c oxidase subunit 2
MTWLPEASHHAALIDILLAGLLIISLAVLALVFGLIILNVVRFHAGRTRPPRPAMPEHKSWRFEIAWTSATLVIFFALFLWAAKLYVTNFEPPAGAIQIYVTGKQWMWKIQYPGGQREINALHVPVGRPVQLLMTSEDVIHDFSVPALRIKHDVLPGRYESLWFKADETGSFRFYCTQFCGIDHSRMTGTLSVMTPAQYAQWMGATPVTGTLAAAGEAIFIRNGCSGCHISSRYPADADTSRAPSMIGLYGSTITLADGRVVIADLAFLHNAIIDPQNWRSRGYTTEMPSFRGVLSEDDLAALVAYLQTLAASAAGPDAGNAVREGN